jgi:lysyl-tRNA synthetase, class II
VAPRIWILGGTIAVTTVVAMVSQPLVELLIGCAVLTIALAGRALLVPSAEPPRASARILRDVQEIVDRCGEDSLSPFIVRPDKNFAFAAGGVSAYRVIGDTAVVSGDPVGPDDAVAELVTRLQHNARGRGLKLVVYGSSPRHLEQYRKLGLRTLCTGEEAVVDPRSFSLEGRAVRKLRQSVTRVHRRGWELSALKGNEVSEELAAEIATVESRWRADHGPLLGFAMAMGDFDPGPRPQDLFLLARSPQGELGAVMRFISHRGKLSLDTMRRVGETPNGLNEALVCRALEIARELGVSEVSLNYAGLGHLIRRGTNGTRFARALTRLTIALLNRRFQMERLVRFNEKFSPHWRPRYLVYESRLALPSAVYRVLQAEGYVPTRLLPVPLATRAALRTRLDAVRSAFAPLQWKAGR